MIKTVNMNIVEKALKAKMRGVRFFPQLILSIYGLEIPHEVTFKVIGGILYDLYIEHREHFSS